jgi:hypothetical protein
MCDGYQEGFEFDSRYLKLIVNRIDGLEWPLLSSFPQSKL